MRKRGPNNGSERVVLSCKMPDHHMAYFLVHSRANSLYFSRSVLYILAISGTNGSSGFGSHSSEQIDNKTEIGRNKTSYIKCIAISKSHYT